MADESPLKPKIIYVTAGQLLVIRVVHPGFIPDRKGWEEQLRPRAVLLKVHNSSSVSFSDPGLTIALTGPDGDTRAYYNPSYPAKET